MWNKHPHSSARRLTVNVCKLCSEDITIFKISTSKIRLLYQNSEKCWQKKQEEKKHLARRQSFLQYLYVQQKYCGHEEDGRQLHKYLHTEWRCGTGWPFRQCRDVDNLRIKAPVQVPVYSYLLPTCRSPGPLTSPCRCSSPRLCHTCSGTPETLHTQIRVRKHSQLISTCEQIWVLILNSLHPLSSEYLLLDEVCSWHTEWHWIWTRLSPACFLQRRTGPEKSQRTSVWSERQIKNIQRAGGLKQTSPERPV